MAVKIYRDLIKNGTIPKGEIGFKNAGSKPVSLPSKRDAVLG